MALNVKAWTLLSSLSKPQKWENSRVGRREESSEKELCEVVEAGRTASAVWHPTSTVWQTGRTWVWKEVEDVSQTIASIVRSKGLEAVRDSRHGEKQPVP